MHSVVDAAIATQTGRHCCLSKAGLIPGKAIVVVNTALLAAQDVLEGHPITMRHDIVKYGINGAAKKLKKNK